MVQSESWDYHFDLFKNYVSETGSALIEDLYETKDGIRLGQWIGQQRKDYKCSRISEDRIHKLEALGMVWDVYELMWQKMFALAKEYYDLYDDLLIPVNYVVNNENLGLWIKNQRIDYKAGLVPQHRIDALNKIEMRWDVKMNTKTSFPEQAMFYYFSKFFPDIIHRHTDFGFEFDIYISSLKVAIEYDGATWHKKERTKKMDLQKNNFCITNDICLYRVRETPLTLYPNCICYNVNAKNQLTLEEVIVDILYKLNIIGFERDTINIKRDTALIYAQYRDFATKDWRAGLSSAKTYYEQNGNLIVPSNYVDLNGFKLGRWLTVQRRHYNNNELTNKRFNQLDELGMLWISKSEYYWFEMYKFVKDYYDKHNNLDIPKDCKNNARDVNQWIKTQKEKALKQTLSNKRQELLKELGIV